MYFEQNLQILKEYGIELEEYHFKHAQFVLCNIEPYQVRDNLQYLSSQNVTLKHKSLSSLFRCIASNREKLDDVITYIKSENPDANITLKAIKDAPKNGYGSLAYDYEEDYSKGSMAA